MVGGSVGSFSAFMAQAGRIVICGDAEDALGDSLYEAVIYVRGKVRSLGADARFDRWRMPIAPLSRICWRKPGCCTTPRNSSAWRRRRICITGTLMPIRSIDHDGPAAGGIGGFDRSTIDYIQRAAASGLYEIRGLGAKRPVPNFDDLLFLAASLSRYPLEGYRERCSTKTLLGTRFATRPIELAIPITVAGMSFGALSARVKEALGRAATEVGTSTTTGDGGMTAEERSSSKTLIYQCLPSRYGFDPDDVRRADAIEIGHRPGRQARRRRHAAGAEGQSAGRAHAHAAGRGRSTLGVAASGLDRTR